MSGRRWGLVVAVGAALIVGAPVGHGEPAAGDVGGCRQGGVMTGRLVPGSGSAGQNIQREGTLRECDSPLLPGVTGGRFSVTIPWNATGATSAATFTWSDGSVSAATGFGNGQWLITAGPASGHGIQLFVANTWSGWYLSPLDVTVTSARFLA
ncbi:hypothetical protein [Nocardia wallacei]|uniref:hypothetical protein n=1 Tax=Nocardia wallacei TaxID=480035 RepID=UPI002458D1B5|nr:hypothetical protein [Nocardia wallacei]